MSLSMVSVPSGRMLRIKPAASSTAIVPQNSNLESLASAQNSNSSKDEQAGSNLFQKLSFETICRIMKFAIRRGGVLTSAAVISLGLTERRLYAIYHSRIRLPLKLKLATRRKVLAVDLRDDDGYKCLESFMGDGYYFCTTKWIFRRKVREVEGNVDADAVSTRST